MNDLVGRETVSATDVGANRKAQKWTRRELAGRFLWTLASPLFRRSPRIGWGWRRMLLRCFGARIGRRVHIHPSVKITIPWNISIGDDAAVGDGAILYALGPISIGKRATVSQFGHLCAGSHDFRRVEMTLLKPPIVIGDDAWICAQAFVGPGVTVGARAVVGAAAVAMRDVPADAIVTGNPAVVTGQRTMRP